MQYFIAICGFLGAWLLVAGPLLQAVLELTEQDLDREMFDQAVTKVPSPPRVSRWWWLLPPVAYFRNRKRSTAHQQAVMAALPAEQRKQAVVFVNKASGWFIVSAGALLLATKETWELVETFELHLAVFWVLVVVAFLLCVLNVVIRMKRTGETLGEAPPEKRASRRRDQPPVDGAGVDGAAGAAGSSAGGM